MEKEVQTVTNVVEDRKDAKEQDALQEHLLLLLADSNLPTGGFVASAGLESFAAHGMLRTYGALPAAQLLSFLSSSLSSYARSAVPYLIDAYRAARSSSSAAEALQSLRKLDASFEASLLSSVARRASSAQGAALLTLYSVALAEPPKLTREEVLEAQASSASRMALEALRRAVRLGEANGHLPICWGVFAAALGIEEARAIRMHLFLQARAILSSAIRLNILGPYAAHGLLHHHVQDVLVSALRNCGVEPGTGLLDAAASASKSATAAEAEVREEVVRDEDAQQGWAWDWEEEGAWAASEQDKRDGAPTVTWPLGELTQARHDALHSRMFNS